MNKNKSPELNDQITSLAFWWNTFLSRLMLYHVKHNMSSQENKNI